MSLPADQQRVLNRMEGGLQAGEPHLSSMYDTFARLCAGEPVTQERVPALRLRWLRSGSAIYAVVLIPVMFAAVLIGSLLGVDARSTATCEAGYTVGGGSPLTGRASCPSGAQTATASTAHGKTAAGGTGATCPASGRASQGSEPAARYVTPTGSEQALLPLARTSSATAGTPPGVC